MDAKKIILLNAFINNAYSCTSFSDFLRLAIMELHKHVIYDSGMFYCAISHDCSYFKPYISGSIDDYYTKEPFSEQQSYLEFAMETAAGKEAYVYKSSDFITGLVKVALEPRKDFFDDQDRYHVCCIRIVYKEQFLGEIYLHRDASKPDFSDNDIFVLSLMQPHISTIFNIIHTQIANKAVEQGSLPVSIGLGVFDSDMTIISSNIIGIEMLKGVTIFGSSVLHHVKELCFSIDGKENKKIDKRTEAIKMKDGDIRIDIITLPAEISDNIRHIVIMKYINENQIVQEYKFKFTKREADIIDGLVQGKNNGQIASTHSISENTVKSHIKRIYSKTGANNRTELSYILMLNN